MAKVKKTVWHWKCERCGHDWLPRTDEEPKFCPACKSPYWNTPRKDAKELDRDLRRKPPVKEVIIARCTAASGDDRASTSYQTEAVYSRVVGAAS